MPSRACGTVFFFSDDPSPCRVESRGRGKTSLNISDSSAGGGSAAPRAKLNKCDSVAKSASSKGPLDPPQSTLSLLFVSFTLPPLNLNFSMCIIFRLLLLLPFFVAPLAYAAAAPLNKPQYGNWGFDSSGADVSTKPGDDFFRFANGTWIDKTQIPPDKPAYSLRIAMTDRTEQRLHDMMEA